MWKNLKELAMRVESLRVVPLAFFVVAPALLIRFKIVAIAPEAGALWPDLFIGDIVSWWKSVFVAGLGLWMAVMAGLGWLTGRRAPGGIFAALLAAAALATFLSALFSPFPVTAWLGYTGHYEGAVALLAYLFAAWYASTAVENQLERLWLLRLAGMVALINILVGVSKGLGWDLWMSAAGRALAGNTGLPFRFIFADTNMASGTVFQPNHFGMFMAMLAMLALGMIAAEKRRGWFIFWCVIGAGSLLSVLFSQSRSAVGVCLVGIFIVAPLVFHAGIIDLWKGGAWRVVLSGRGARLGLAVAGVFLLLFALLGGLGRAKETAGVMVGRFSAMLNAKKHEYALESVELKDNRIILSLSGTEYGLTADARNRWALQSGEGAAQKTLPAVLRKDHAGMDWLEIPGGAGCSFGYDDMGNALLICGRERVRFLAVDGNVYAIDYKGRPHESVITPPTVNLGAVGRLFGDRGYIWERALALVPSHPWLGFGPGTFALVFPNADLLGKQRYFANIDEDKGHGIWATFLVQSGVIGFTLYLLPVAYALYRALRAGDPLSRAVALGMIAYLAGAVTNDSTVGVTPIFCVLAGLAVSQSHRTPASDKPAAPTRRKDRRSTT